MAPTTLPARSLNGVDRVRHKLLTALHIGKLTPGDRVPSVRRLADLTGMNRKTVHRAYRHLAGEGLLDLRPGSGTFVAEKAGSALGTPIGELVLAANRCRAAAGGLGLEPEAFISFLQIYLGAGLRGLPVAVAECNGEQLHLIGQELKAVLGLAPRPVLLSELASNPRQSLQQSFAVVTTDCHIDEVRAHVGRLGLSVHRLALDPLFVERLVEQARESRVIMLVRDTGFVPVFLRLLRQMAVEPEIIQRFQIVEPERAAALLAQATGPAALHVSPRVAESEVPELPRGCRRLRIRWHIEPTSLERLKAGLALDLMSRERRKAPLRRLGRVSARRTVNTTSVAG